MKVVWTKEALFSFENILDYLYQRWTATEVNAFIDIVEHAIDQIVLQPEMHKISEYDVMSRGAVLSKHTTMFYRILENTIEIEYFWNNFQNPEKLDKILNT